MAAELGSRQAGLRPCAPSAHRPWGAGTAGQGKEGGVCPAHSEKRLVGGGTHCCYGGRGRRGVAGAADQLGGHCPIRAGEVAEKGRQTEPSLEPARNGGAGASLRQGLGESHSGGRCWASLGHGSGQHPEAGQTPRGRKSGQSSRCTEWSRDC